MPSRCWNCCKKYWPCQPTTGVVATPRRGSSNGNDSSSCTRWPWNKCNKRAKINTRMRNNNNCLKNNCSDGPVGNNSKNNNNNNKSPSAHKAVTAAATAVVPCRAVVGSFWNPSCRVRNPCPPCWGAMSLRLLALPLSLLQNQHRRPKVALREICWPMTTMIQWPRIRTSGSTFNRRRPKTFCWKKPSTFRVWKSPRSWPPCPKKEAKEGTTTTCPWPWQRLSMKPKTTTWHEPLRSPNECCCNKNKTRNNRHPPLSHHPPRHPRNDENHDWNSKPSPPCTTTILISSFASWDAFKSTTLGLGKDEYRAAPTVAPLLPRSCAFITCWKRIAKMTGWIKIPFRK
mmetsp:Transcript_16608/g.38283  ORF Transcript_16608/g.38283 Transcript_16608/m.38283 type:complete len:343 (-) Transcript_16608:725-1753(-)